MRITAALVLALATQAHAQTVTQIETSTTSDDILVSFDRSTCPGGGPAAIRESDKNFKTIIGLLMSAHMMASPLTVTTVNDGGVCRIGNVRTGAAKP